MKEVKRLIRCDNGHFYDGGKYDECPHCNSTKIPEETVFIGKHVTEEDIDRIRAAHKKTKADEEVVAPKVKKGRYEDVFSDSETERKKSRRSKEKDENLTKQLYAGTIGTEPVTGWLVCIAGVHEGEDFKIKRGRNFIGRAGNMDISLSGDRAVSRDKHAILTYDPKGNTFFLQLGESNELCYVNGVPILVPTKLKINDRITLGDSELIFIPFCSDAFSWSKKDAE